MAIDVKSFTDRAGNRVTIGDYIGYFNVGRVMLVHGKVTRIRKSGYFIEVFTEGNKHSWSKSWIEKIDVPVEDTQGEGGQT